MNDKELLELAAKAAGYSTSKYWHNDGVYCGAEYEYTDGPDGWNPLTNDGDALRLAVKLNILRVYIHNDEVAIAPSEYGVIEPITNNDPYAATRRAIVRVGAEIGKTK